MTGTTITGHRPITDMLCAVRIAEGLVTVHAGYVHVRAIETELRLVVFED
jgi:hypothetical protein